MLELLHEISPLDKLVGVPNKTFSILAILAFTTTLKENQFQESMQSVPELRKHFHHNFQVFRW